MQADTIAALRAAGIPMRARRMGTQYGWTTSSATADKGRNLGAKLTAYTATDEKFSGWELRVDPDPPTDESEAERV